MALAAPAPILRTLEITGIYHLGWPSLAQSARSAPPSAARQEGHVYQPVFHARNVGGSKIVFGAGAEQPRQVFAAGPVSLAERL